jgi:hypothetical protein
MDRLTKTYSDGTHGASDDLPCGENSYDYKNLLIDKLGKYEDLEEQGRLVKLPCKVGDVVYFVHHDRVISSEVLSEKYHAEAENHGVFIRERLTIDVEGVSAEIDFSDIGKTVFLTKSEAETKLKELRGGENE